MNEFTFKYEGYIKDCKWKSIFVSLENVLGRQNRYISFSLNLIIKIGNI